MNRLETLLESLRARRGTGLVACVVAGYPDLATTAHLLRELPKRGADALEVVVPSTDPVADGPVLASAHARGIRCGAALEGVLDLVRSLRASDPVTPVLAMGYLNSVHFLGPREFFRRCREAGLDGVVLVDLPLEHRAPWKAGAAEAGIALVPSWAPTADPARTREVLSQNDLLAYLVTRRGTTGGALWDPAEIVRRARESRALGGPALMAGFGIRTREQLQELSGEVDLAVVGTLLAEALESGGGPEAVLRLVSELAG